ncbi:MAG: hypothetical protein J6P05_00910 [Lachnospiraceae bacterium]|nr:hypothetical protein [Lachnospiraceae bacterium]
MAKKQDLRFLNNEAFHELTTVYTNKEDTVYNSYKTPKSDKKKKGSYEQWKEFYIADYAPNLSEEIVNEPVENPATGELEFIKLSFLDILSFGDKSGVLAQRIRTEVVKAAYTGKSPAAGLRDLVLKEIELGDKIVIDKCFSGTVQHKGHSADTWWAEEGIKEKKVDRKI